MKKNKINNLYLESIFNIKNNELIKLIKRGVLTVILLVSSNVYADSTELCYPSFDESSTDVLLDAPFVYAYNGNDSISKSMSGEGELYCGNEILVAPYIVDLELSSEQDTLVSYWKVWAEASNEKRINLFERFNKRNLSLKNQIEIELELAKFEADYMKEERDLLDQFIKSLSDEQLLALESIDTQNEREW